MMMPPVHKANSSMKTWCLDLWNELDLLTFSTSVISLMLDWDQKFAQASQSMVVALKCARDPAVMNGCSTAKQLLLLKFHHFFVNHKASAVIQALSVVTVSCRSKIIIILKHGKTQQVAGGAQTCN